MSIVIVGAGQAGGELATGLRRLGCKDPITLLGDEPHAPYQRPPLSKGFLEGSLGPEQLLLKSRATYARFDIELRTHTRVTEIDRAARTLTLDDGSTLPWRKLVLATGGRARRLEVAGSSKVFFLRTIADVEAMRPVFVPGARLVIIGGGYIGLEVAAVAVQHGLSVDVVESAPRLLPRVTGPEVASFLEGVHRSHGVRFHFDRCVTRIDEGRVHLGAEVLEADFVLIGVGLVPNVELALEAGLVVNDGIVVDAHAVTSDPDVLAIGDCANQPSSYLGARVRLQSVPNAIEHARIAALTLIGRPETSAAVPWFWSEQYGLKLQSVGLMQGATQCVTRSSKGGFAAYYVRDGRLLAADLIGDPAEFMLARRWVAASVAVDAQALADPNRPLTDAFT